MAAGDRLTVDRVLKGVEMRPGGSAIGGSADVLKLREGIDFYFIYLKRIEDTHCYRIRPLIGQMPPDPGAEHLVRLPDVNWFAIVVVKDIDAPPEV